MINVNKEELANIDLLKTKQFLKPLLYNIREEEPEVIDSFSKMKSMNAFNFNKSFLIISDVQIYKCMSILGLTSNFSRDINYTILNMATLLDIWYNESSLCSKDTLKSCDILIVTGKTDKINGFRKANALIELIDIRKSYGKLTWVYINGTKYNEFNAYQPRVITKHRLCLCRFNWSKGYKFKI